MQRRRAASSRARSDGQPAPLLMRASASLHVVAVLALWHRRREQPRQACAPRAMLDASIVFCLTGDWPRRRRGLARAPGGLVIRRALCPSASRRPRVPLLAHELRFVPICNLHLFLAPSVARPSTREPCICADLCAIGQVVALHSVVPHLTTSWPQTAAYGRREHEPLSSLWKQLA